MLICSKPAPAPLSILAMLVPSAAAPFTTRTTISTTLHCPLEQVCSRDWSRKNCHDYPAFDIHRLLLVEPGPDLSASAIQCEWQDQFEGRCSSGCGHASMRPRRARLSNGRPTLGSRRPAVSCPQCQQPTLPAFWGHLKVCALNATADVSYGSEAAVSIRSNVRVRKPYLLDHVIGTSKQRKRNRQPKRFCRLQIDHQLELGRLLDGEIGRLRPL